MNKSTGPTKTELGVRNQILADVGNQSSVGCVVPATLGVTVGSKKIAKAGTPVSIDLMSTQTPAVLATSNIVAGAETGKAMIGVLLHDVDVTDGNNNGTALLFGFVNVNRIDADVQTLVANAVENANASKLVTFMKV
jgi:hypothetical protein